MHIDTNTASATDNLVSGARAAMNGAFEAVANELNTITLETWGQPLKDAWPHPIQSSRLTLDLEQSDPLHLERVTLDSRTADQVVVVGRPRPGRVETIRPRDASEQPAFDRIVLLATRYRQLRDALEALC